LVDGLLGQICARDVFHAEIRLTIVLSNIQNWHNVGVIQFGSQPRLPPEPAFEVRVGMIATEDCLKRHNALITAMTRLVNHSHATMANDFQNLILTNIRQFSRVRPDGHIGGIEENRAAFI
jgi:hypothetical protein